MDEWKHIATIIDGEKFQINGISIRDFKWKNTYIGIKVMIHITIIYSVFTYIKLKLKK
jgi:hypothetical protein